MKKSMQIEKMETIRNNLRSYEESFLEDGAKVSKFSVNTSSFEAVMTHIEKVEFNGLLIKISNKVDQSHKSGKRSSMMFGGSGIQSVSYLKTPKQMTKDRLSTSTLEGEKKAANGKLNEE